MIVNRLRKASGMRDIEFQERRCGGRNVHLQVRNKLLRRCVTKSSFAASERVNHWREGSGHDSKGMHVLRQS